MNQSYFIIQVSGIDSAKPFLKNSKGRGELYGKFDSARRFKEHTQALDAAKVWSGIVREVQVSMI